MRIKNLHAALLSIGAVDIEPGAEADITSANDALIAAWLSAGLIADVTPAAPPKKSDK